MHIGPFESKTISWEKLLGFKVDCKLSFNENWDGIIKKASVDNTICDHKQKAHSYEFIFQLTI